MNNVLGNIVLKYALIWIDWSFSFINWGPQNLGKELDWPRQKLCYNFIFKISYEGNANRKHNDTAFLLLEWLLSTGQVIAMEGKAPPWSKMVKSSVEEVTCSTGMKG